MRFQIHQPGLGTIGCSGHASKTILQFSNFEVFRPFVTDMCACYRNLVKSEPHGWAFHIQKETLQRVSSGNTAILQRLLIPNTQKKLFKQRPQTFEKSLVLKYSQFYSFYPWSFQDNLSFFFFFFCGHQSSSFSLFFEFEILLKWPQLLFSTINLFFLTVKRKGMLPLYLVLYEAVLPNS